jgi:hypothetical protein
LLDRDAFKPLLSYDDEGIRDMDEHEEIPYDILSPLNNGFANKKL